MKQDTKLEMGLKSYDDIFKLNTGKDGKAEMVVVLSIDDIDDFKNHPFKIKNDEKMQEMVESVKQNGILLPVLVRPKGERGYEMISGHRRKFACNLAGKKEIPAIVRELTDDEATILMVDSNMQREEILPSEKAFAYKMKLLALSHQGKRNDLTSCQVGTKFRSDIFLAEKSDDSARQIQRYIRLTELIPDLLEKVDKKIIAFNPAVEISYLKENEQYILLDYIEYNDATPTHSQAINLKKLSLSGKLDENKIDEILSEEKPNQVPMMKFNERRIRSVLPKNIERDKIEDYVIKSIEFYSRHIKQKNMSER